MKTRAVPLLVRNQATGTCRDRWQMPFGELTELTIAFPRVHNHTPGCVPHNKTSPQTPRAALFTNNQIGKAKCPSEGEFMYARWLSAIREYCLAMKRVELPRHEKTEKKKLVSKIFNPK